MRRSHRRRRPDRRDAGPPFGPAGRFGDRRGKEAEVYPLPRAAHLDHEIIRVFQEVGAAEAIVRSSRQSSRYDFLNAAGEILLRFTGSDRIGPGGWPAANMIHQPSVERVLRDRLADYPAPAWSRAGTCCRSRKAPMA
jgi:2-polyprenyl-6-methoxyphenol hydroxylase-like FAD-dependent oxidoreductase